MAGATRLELATSGVTGRRSNQLNYAPRVEKSAWWGRTSETLILSWNGARALFRWRRPSHRSA